MNLFQRFIEWVVGYPVDWGDTAAWVQAVGSLVALYIAIELPKRAARRQRKTFRLTVVAYCRAIREGAKAAAILDGSLHQVADATQIRTISMEVNLPSLISAVENLPLAQLDNNQAVDATVRLVGAARAFVGSPVPSSLSIDEAMATLINGRTPRRHALDQIEARYELLLTALGFEDVT